MADNTDDTEEIVLASRQRDALLSAANQFIDEAFDGFARVCNGKSIKNTIFAKYLPSQYQHLYDKLFLKKFLICVIRVAGRLPDWNESGDWNEVRIPACTAECLALRAIVRKAEALAEREAEEKETEPEGDFDLFIDMAFPDTDAEFLFDPKRRGIEHSDVARDMGMYIAPEQWFVPAYGKVHPCCEDVT